jgi:hypothetical protein
MIQVMTAAAETETFTTTQAVTLPAIFINRAGEPETLGIPSAADAFQGDTVPFSDRGEENDLSGLIEQPESAAMNRLRRALFETGQLVVTPRDGVSRISFAGVGDPERLFVESTPRNEPIPLLDCDFPGCLCSLSQAEAILRRIYRGESSEKLAAYLDSRSSAQRRRREAA